MSKKREGFHGVANMSSASYRGGGKPVPVVGSASGKQSTPFSRKKTHVEVQGGKKGK